MATSTTNEYGAHSRSTVGVATLPDDPPEFRRFLARSRPLDLDGIDWSEVQAYTLPDDVLRILAYMQEVESHTVVFPRTIFTQRALDDDVIGTFLVCWLYEEGVHGRALAKFLACAGHPVPPKSASRLTIMDRVNRWSIALVGSVWKDFLALHMTWAALHECTTMHAYKRLIQISDHPILNRLLARIAADEARHFAFYMWQAKIQLANPRVRSRVRKIMNRLYVPVGTSHQPAKRAKWVSAMLFDGPDGRAAAHHVDSSIAELPGFSDAEFLTGWLERHVYADQPAAA